MSRESKSIRSKTARKQQQNSDARAVKKKYPRRVQNGIVGLLFMDRGRPYAKPILSEIKEEVLVQDAHRFQHGDVVIVDGIIRKSGAYRGKVSQKISGANTLDLAVNTALLAKKRSRTWLSAIEEQKFPSTVDQEDIKGRVDLRSLPLVTIDGRFAKDFDDAVYAESLPTGGWKLVVAIADVAHYVKLNSELDQEAKSRGFSVYFPTRVIPMLPEQLSNGICSLVPGEDRLAMTTEMVIDESGVVKQVSFQEAVIRSHARLTYGEVNRLLQTGDENKVQDASIRDSLYSLKSFCEKRLELRSERGGLDFDIPEASVQIENNEPTGVYLTERNFAHQMIEEAMVLTNQVVAEKLAQHCKPMYRVHEPPDEESLYRVGNQFGMKNLPSKIEEYREGPLQMFFKDLAKKKGNSPFWNFQLVKNLPPARYSFTNQGHFGLALDQYLHFTSPIRRYSDLYNHRLLKDVIHQRPIEQDEEELTSYSERQSNLEREIDEMSRYVDRWLTCKWVERRIGTTDTGIVSGVTSFGLFVDLDKHLTSGLIHISKLGHEYYELENEKLVAEWSGATYSLGDKLKVWIKSVDPILGYVDLGLRREHEETASTRR